MSRPVIEHLPRDVDSEKLVGVLDRDGCAVVEGALSPEQLAGLNGELDALVAATDPGTPGHLPAYAEFYGNSTVRIDGLPGKSATFVDVVQNPLLLAMADHYLLPSCAHYLLSTAQLIEIGPGETAQALHRDELAWMHHPRQQDLEVEAIYALTDFTATNGATQVVPGSHRWDALREPMPEEIVAAEMPAGSAVVFKGDTIHGGGANGSEGERRRGLFTGFCLGWLRTEENFFLSTPIEAVREMPERVQQLLGYEPHMAIGVVDVGSPMKLLRG